MGIDSQKIGSLEGSGDIDPGFVEAVNRPSESRIGRALRSITDAVKKTLLAAGAVGVMGGGAVACEPMGYDAEGQSADATSNVDESGDVLPAFGTPQVVINKGIIVLTGTVPGGNPVAMNIRVLDENGGEIQTYTEMVPNRPDKNYAVMEQLGDSAKTIIIEDDQGRAVKPVEVKSEETVETGSDPYYIPPRTPFQM